VSLLNIKFIFCHLSTFRV